MKLPPWVGAGFGKPNNHNLPKRLLLVGESCWSEESNPPNGLITKVVNDYIDRGGHRFLNGMLRAILGLDAKPSHNERRSFYNSVAFYNFIRDVLERPRVPPTKEQWECGCKVFPSCLDLLKPSHVVVFGFRLWNNMDHEGFSRDFQLEQDLLCYFPEKYQRKVREHPGEWIGRYSHSGGESLVMWVRHASAPGFNAEHWHPVLQWFLQLEE